MKLWLSVLHIHRKYTMTCRFNANVAVGYGVYKCKDTHQWCQSCIGSFNWCFTNTGLKDWVKNDKSVVQTQTGKSKSKAGNTRLVIRGSWKDSRLQHLIISNSLKTSWDKAEPEWEWGDLQQEFMTSSAMVDTGKHWAASRITHTLSQFSVANPSPHQNWRTRRKPT